MASRVAIIGSGQTNHRGRRLDVNGQEMISEAVQRALDSSGLTMKEIDGILIGNMDHIEGINSNELWALPGISGHMKPVVKLCTGGTTGTTLAIAGYHMVASGFFDRLLVVGWEKNSESDTTAAIITAFDPIWERLAIAGAIGGLAAESQKYLSDYGLKQEDGARVVQRDRKNAVNNPHAHVRKEVSIKRVMASPMLADPIKHLDMCPRTDGACAVIYANEYEAPKLAEKPAWILSTSVRHNYAYIADVNLNGLQSMIHASKEMYEYLDIKEPLKEIDVIEMYLPYSYAGLSWIESLGLCKPGRGPELLWNGTTDMDGELPINPSGGPISANPIGATALIRVAEASLQIQRRADQRQVQDVKMALATGFGSCMWTDLIMLGADKP